MFWENAILVPIRAGVFWKKVRSCLQANLLHVVENDQRYLHLLSTTVSNVLYSLGHVLAAPHCPPCWGKYCPPCRQVGGRSAYGRPPPSAFKSYGSNYGRSAFEPEGAGGPGRGRAIHLEAEERSKKKFPRIGGRSAYGRPPPSAFKSYGSNYGRK